MTTRRTTALLVGMLLGIALAVVTTFVVPRPLVLVLLRDDFSDRTFMKDDPKEPIPEEPGVIFFAPVQITVEPGIESTPAPAAEILPSRPPDPLERPRTRSGAYDPLPPRR